MGRPSKHSPEVRERAVRMVFDHAPEHPSQWAAIRSVGEKTRDSHGIVAPLGAAGGARWAGTRPGLTTTEREELKRLQREVVELKRANEILKKAAAFFAQAELDRRAK
jgi:transposase